MFDTGHTPPPSVPRAVRDFWQVVFAEAMSYTTIDEYYTEDAELTATVAAKTQAQGCHGKSHLPPLGDLVNLTGTTGTFQSVDYAEPSGRIVRENARRTAGDLSPKMPLIWSRSARALLILPHLSVGACNLPPVGADSRLLNTWTRGRRKGRCSSRIGKLPRGPLPVCRPGIAISYRSDKFGDDGEMTSYIHHFDSPGVRVWMCRRQPVPSAILIQGGQLRITKDGIAG